MKYIISIRRQAEQKEIKKLFPNNWTPEFGLEFKDLKKIRDNNIIIGRLGFDLIFRLGELIENFIYFYIPSWQGERVENAFDEWGEDTSKLFRGNRTPIFTNGSFIFFEHVITRTKNNNYPGLFFTKKKLTHENILRKFN